MNVGLISDTHGFVSSAALDALRGVDVILHAGDVGDPLVVKMLQTVAPVLVVLGNTDPLGLYPASVDVELEGLRIHMSHGHELEALGWFLTPEKLAAQYPCDILIFGHTHFNVVRTVGTTLVINPGAAGSRYPTVVRLELPSRTVTIVKCSQER